MCTTTVNPTGAICVWGTTRTLWCRGCNRHPASLVCHGVRSWMTCLSGGVEEHRFALPPGEQHSSLSTPRSPAKRPDLPGVLAAESPCPRLEAGPVTRLAPGQTAYICDNIVRARVRRAACSRSAAIRQLLLCSAGTRRIFSSTARTRGDAWTACRSAGAARRSMRRRRRGAARRRFAAPVRAAHPAHAPVRARRRPRHAARAGLLLRRRRAARCARSRCRRRAAAGAVGAGAADRSAHLMYSCMAWRRRAQPLYVCGDERAFAYTLLLCR